LDHWLIIKYVLKINIYQEDNLWLFNNYNLVIAIYSKSKGKSKRVYTLFDITIKINKKYTILKDKIIL
jgi:hypothetical protein